MKRLVSDEWLKLAGATAEKIMRDDATREAWLDENRFTSANRGSVLHFETDYDWIVAFFVWYHRYHYRTLPRTRNGRTKEVYR